MADQEWKPTPVARAGARAAATGQPQEQYLGRVKATAAYETVLPGQAGKLQSVVRTPDGSLIASVEFDWLVLPATMAGTMTPQPNIGAQVPFSLLAAIDNEREPNT